MFDDVIDALNQLSENWKNQYWDEEDPDMAPPDIPMRWSIRDGMATIDDLQVYPIEEINISDLQYDVEWLYLPTFDGYDIVLYIVWPYEGKPSYLAVRTAVNLNKEE